MSALSAASSCKAVARSSTAALRVLQTTGPQVKALVVPVGTSMASSCVDAASQKRSISSMSSKFLDRNNRPSFSSSSYAALRNMVTSPFQAQSNNTSSYVSPYSDFFANIEAGRSSLGTTEEMEEKLSKLSMQKLDCGICESDLRFRTVSYGRFALPPYVSPGEHRVTVTLRLDAIPWDSERGEAEKEILLQIVGSRYNPEKNELKLSSEKFGSRIENKRYLVGMIEKIVSNSRELASQFAAEDEQS
mmetsp:Transcript_20969/g.30024  ORF Transcript_20969/g.30024 Transcript_20969/m.30024 type:complete len:247 (+) Transcript_20969:100-840(+)|eukprot:CAMPEP_0201700708 /NCGR_PEP_ID=MMETSP0578-20130828/29579_1 /ASSEMBLY_ACC=CAM_ASM_000663 /TAXON_ID=267565 /ORGANISM="Skeletonema grethea, Strain CCMP 1804" /LENGTH=246 /DNA_ID=CAMNT_0048187819 /DNA_START=70 /DNA_END=810 /DNA_ORIENTATION=+